MVARLQLFFQRHQTIFGTIWLAILFLLSFSYAMFQGGFVSWFVFYSFLPVLINSVLLLIYPLSDLKIKRIIKKRELFGGETLQVTVEINRRLPFPLFYLLIEDQLPKRLVSKEDHVKRGRSKGLFSLGFSRMSSYTYKVENMPRGEYKFDLIEIKTGDFFGFIQKKRLIPIEDTVLIYPKVELLGEWTPQDLAYGGSHRSKKHFEHDLTSISSIRDYMPGDRLSWLDWKATARVNHLVTKQFEYPLNRDVIVVLDTFGEVCEVEGFETSITLAASLVYRTIKLGASVGFISIGKESTFFELSHRATIKWQILNHLVTIESNGQGEVAYSLTKYLQKLPRQATIVYVTTQANEKDMRLFNDIAQRGLAVEYFYVKTSELEQKTAALMGRLETQGIQTYYIRSNEINQELKAGGTRATS